MSQAADGMAGTGYLSDETTPDSEATTLLSSSPARSKRTVRGSQRPAQQLEPLLFALRMEHRIRGYLQRILGSHQEVADLLLFDAKPPRRPDALPGGNGLAFDWALIADRSWRVPWMLSGGLTAELLPEAVRISGAAAVDVSSGVESRPGVKDPAKIRAFLAATSALQSPKAAATGVIRRRR